MNSFWPNLDLRSDDLVFVGDLLFVRLGFIGCLKSFLKGLNGGLRQILCYSQLQITRSGHVIDYSDVASSENGVFIPRSINNNNELEVTS
jgi:hypothetical protein